MAGCSRVPSAFAWAMISRVANFMGLGLSAAICVKAIAPALPAAVVHAVAGSKCGEGDVLWNRHIGVLLAPLSDEVRGC
jgi:hypothetical protein